MESSPTVFGPPSLALDRAQMRDLVSSGVKSPRKPLVKFKSPSRAKEPSRAPIPDGITAKQWESVATSPRRVADLKEASELRAWMREQLSRVTGDEGDERRIFNVGFHQLLKQVSGVCTERARLLEELWRKNRDAFEKHAARKIAQTKVDADNAEHEKLRVMLEKCDREVEAARSEAEKWKLEVQKLSTELTVKTEAASSIQGLRTENDEVSQRARNVGEKLRNVEYSLGSVESRLAAALCEASSVTSENIELNRHIDVLEVKLSLALYHLIFTIMKMTEQRADLKKRLATHFKQKFDRAIQCNSIDLDPMLKNETFSKERNGAASRIQAMWRGQRVRCEVKPLLEAARGVKVDVSTKVRYSEMNMPKIPTLFRKFGFEKQLPITVRLFPKQRDVLVAIGRIYGAAIKRLRDNTIKRMDAEYTSNLAYGASPTGIGKEDSLDFAEFLYEFYLENTGHRDTAENDMMSLFASVDRYKQTSPRIAVFKDFCDGAFSAAAFSFFLKAFLTIRTLGTGPFLSLTDNKNGVMWVEVDVVSPLVNETFVSFSQDGRDAIVNKIANSALTSAQYRRIIGAARAPGSERFIEVDEVLKIFLASFVEEEKRSYHILYNAVRKQTQEASCSLDTFKRILEELQVHWSKAEVTQGYREAIRIAGDERLSAPHFTKALQNLGVMAANIELADSNFKDLEVESVKSLIGDSKDDDAQTRESDDVPIEETLEENRQKMIKLRNHIEVLESKLNTTIQEWKGKLRTSEEANARRVSALTTTHILEVKGLKENQSDTIEEMHRQNVEEVSALKKIISKATGKHEHAIQTLTADYDTKIRKLNNELRALEAQSEREGNMKMYEIEELRRKLETERTRKLMIARKPFDQLQQRIVDLRDVIVSQENLTEDLRMDKERQSMAIEEMRSRTQMLEKTLFQLRCSNSSLKRSRHNPLSSLLTPRTLGGSVAPKYDRGKYSRAKEAS